MTPETVQALNRRRRYTVCIDFDGTICEHAFPKCGPLKPGAKEAIDKLSEKYEIVISSCRTSALYRNQPGRESIVQDMLDFLGEHDIFYDRVDMGDEGKVVALAYIDDRGIKFEGWDKEYDI